MRRPLCLLCLVFLGMVMVGLWMQPGGEADYGWVDGQRIVAEGQVYRREYKEQKFGQGQILALYLKEVRILNGPEAAGVSGYGLAGQGDVGKGQAGNVGKGQPGDVGKGQPGDGWRGQFFSRKPDGIVCYMEEDARVPEIGRTVRVSGKARCFSKAGNWGEFDMEEYYRMMGLSFRLEDGSLTACRGKVNYLGERLERLKAYFSGALDAVFPPKEASILQAMLLGEKEGLDGEVKKLYRDSSIIHILSISGLHISIIGMGLYRLLRRVGMPLKVGALCSIGLIWSYGLMTGMSLSAVRAIIMFVLHLTADMAGRTYDLLTALAFSAIVLLAGQPSYVRYSGFLFSFGAVASIGVLLPALYQEKRPKGRKRFWRLKQAVACCGAVTIGTLPVHLMFSYQFPWYSFLLNLAVIPLMTVVMADGLFCMLAGGFAPALARAVGLVDRVILWFYEQCCLLGGRLPYGTLRSGRPENWQLAGYILLLALLAAMARRGGRRLSAFWKAQWILAALCILFLRTESGLRVTALDVGQGDCIHIRSGEGKHYLIDAGSSSKSGMTQYQLLPYLKYQGVEWLEVVFVTHSDSDHCSAVLDMLEEYQTEGIGIRCLALPDISRESADEKYMEMVKRAKEHGISVQYMSRGQYVEDGGMRLTCMHPYRGYDTSEPNEYSLVLLLTYGSFSGLFAGDVEGGGEEEVWAYMEEYLAGRGGVIGREEGIKGAEVERREGAEEREGDRRREESIKAAGVEEAAGGEGDGGRDSDGREEPGYGRLTLLKVAHHGSGYSTKEEMLSALRPRLALISCGKDNRYGHPHKELLERLENAGCRIFITAQKGAVAVETDGRQVWVESFQ